MILLITTDRGLCGGLNTNILKKAVEYIDQNKEKTEISLIAVGKKGRDFVQRYGQKIFAEFTDFGDIFDIMDISPIAQIPLDDFVAKNTDKVVLIYTDFVSTIMQKPVIKELLPLTRESLIKLTEIGKNIQEAKNQKPEAEDKKLRTKNLELRTEIQYEYTFEPTPEKVLAVLLPRLVEMQIYQAMLESNASEHSARMVAMKNASDNALEIIDELNLSYNQARQASITKEIAEISAGKAALEE